VTGIGYCFEADPTQDDYWCFNNAKLARQLDVEGKHAIEYCNADCDRVQNKAVTLASMVYVFFGVVKFLSTIGALIFIFKRSEIEKEPAACTGGLFYFYGCSQTILFGINLIMVVLMSMPLIQPCYGSSYGIFLFGLFINICGLAVWMYDASTLQEDSRNIFAVEFFRQFTGATPCPSLWQMTTVSSNSPPSCDELAISYALAVLKAEKNRYAASLVYDDLLSLIMGLASTRFFGDAVGNNPMQMIIKYGILFSEIISAILLVLLSGEMPSTFWWILFAFSVILLLWTAVMVSPMCLIMISMFVIFLAEMVRRRRTKVRLSSSIDT